LRGLADFLFFQLGYPVILAAGIVVRKSDMERFTVTAETMSPVILGGGYLTLDALLASLIFEATGDVDVAHDTVPLARTNGLFHASAALLEPLSSSQVAFVANLQAMHSLDPDLIQKNKHGQLHKKIGLTRRRDFGAVMNSYTSFQVDKIIWYAEGDPVAVEGLLSNVRFIGKRRASGYGEVSGWSIQPGEFDGVVGPFGGPMRPVPTEMFSGDQRSLKVDAAWRPAYWHPDNRAICFAPDLIQ
jgi:hypothetical protein